MTPIAITDLPEAECRRETLLEGRFEVRSRSGLHPVERALAEAAPRFASAARHLVTGNRTGVLPLVLRAIAPGSRVAVHGFDIHHLRAVARNLAANGVGCPAFPMAPWAPAEGDIALSCLDRPPDGPFDVAWLQTAVRDTPSEVAQSWVQDLHGRLADGGTLVVATDGPVAWMQGLLRKIFGRVSVLPPAGGASLLVARRTGPIRRPRDFSAAFEATLPDGLPPLALRTLPGVFAHRRPDAGGLALAEVASRLFPECGRVLDLGCGCGLVGLLLARHAREAVLVDSDARAFACAEANARANGLDARCRVVLNDEGVGECGPFDLVVGNPPYYSDFAIAGRFVREAGRVLRPGGTALMVARQARPLAGLLEKFVGPATIEARRGYQVAVAARRIEAEG